MKNVIIIRGVSGSGKSTVAKLFKHSVICTTDDYFLDEEGNYNFNRDELSQAHDSCYRKFVDATSKGIETIIVANTNTHSKEWFRYYDHAVECGYQVHFLVVENRHGNDSIHSVPQETLNRQENNIRQSLKLI